MSGDERDEAEIDVLLRSLPPVEPPAKTLAATEAALARARGAKAGKAGKAARWAWVGVAAAIALGIGLPMARRAPMGDLSAASNDREQQATNGNFQLGPTGGAGDELSWSRPREPEPATPTVDAPAVPAVPAGPAGIDQYEATIVTEKPTGHAGDGIFDDGEGGAAPPRVDANGYFANTYLPGDPELAQLRASLVRGLYRDGVEVPLEALATPVVQPFDAPTERAVAITVAADRDAVSGPTRVTLQVGIAGAEVRPTRRAPIAMALVVDLASIADDAERRSLWGIAEAFIAARQPGDRMALVAATASGPEVASGVTLRDERGGLGFLASAYERRGGSLATALERAYVEARAPEGDEVSASVVVLATARTPDARLAAWVHERAVAGTELSVIGVGGRVAVEPVAALVQAGEGRRWFVATADGAARVVDDEIAASGRTVARALRLSLVLGRGVELHGVLGSHALGQVAADAVRESEVAIDQRVQEATGIASDRGADEAGIQIVIPAFMAGDRHVILLDVTVPGPGAVLDVRARWKDLVRMDNGAAETALTLGRGDRQDSPAADNVRDNRAAYETAKVLRAAAVALAAGRIDEARALIAAAARDAGAADQRLFSAYAGVLATPEAAARGALSDHLVRSLQAAAAARLGAP